MVRVQREVSTVQRAALVKIWEEVRGTGSLLASSFPHPFFESITRQVANFDIWKQKGYWRLRDWIKDWKIISLSEIRDRMRVIKSLQFHYMQIHNILNVNFKR